MKFPSKLRNFKFNFCAHNYINAVHVSHTGAQRNAQCTGIGILGICNQLTPMGILIVVAQWILKKFWNNKSNICYLVTVVVNCCWQHYNSQWQLDLVFQPTKWGCPLTNILWVLSLCHLLTHHPGPNWNYPRDQLGVRYTGWGWRTAICLQGFSVGDDLIVE